MRTRDLAKKIRAEMWPAPVDIFMKRHKFFIQQEIKNLQIVYAGIRTVRILGVYLDVHEFIMTGHPEGTWTITCKELLITKDSPVTAFRELKKRLF